MENIRKRTISRSSFISSCRESRSGILSTVAIRGAFAFASPRRRYLSTSFPMLPFSRSNLPTRSSYIYLPYLRYMFVVRRRDDGRRFAQLNTIRSVLRSILFSSPLFSPPPSLSLPLSLFSFSFLSPRPFLSLFSCFHLTVSARAVDQRIRCRSLAGASLLRL